jgi:hypothetical protein
MPGSCVPLFEPQRIVMPFRFPPKANIALTLRIYTQIPAIASPITSSQFASVSLQRCALLHSNPFAIKLRINNKR